MLNQISKALLSYIQGQPIHTNGQSKPTEQKHQECCGPSKITLKPNTVTISEAGLAHLSNATSVNLSNCHNITDNGLAYLSNATSVDLWGCYQITDAGLEHLKKAKVVYLCGCDQITDAGLARFKASNPHCKIIR